MSGFAAREGTVAHGLLQTCLTNIYDLGMDADPVEFLGKTIVIEDEGGHASASPSGAKAWLRCSKKLNAERALGPEEPDGRYEMRVDLDMVNGVRMCLDYVAERVRELEETFGPGTVEVHTERKVSPAIFLYTDACNGTSDISLVVLAGRFVEHMDYKHGVGVPVEVTDPQNDLYLLGTIAEHTQGNHEGEAVLPFDTARLTVIQPRCRKINPSIRFREVDVKEWLPKAIERFKTGLARIEEHPDKATPHEDACRFCRAKATCKEYLEWSMAPLGDLGPPVDPSAPPLGLGEAVSDSWATTVLLHKERILAAVKAAEEYIADQLKRGVASSVTESFFELTPARTQKRWAHDEAETLRRLKRIKVFDPKVEKVRALGKKELFEETLLSPARVLKLYTGLKATEVQMAAVRDAIVKPEGELRVTRKKDRLSADEAFGEDFGL